MEQATRESITADISSRVAENAVCWCEGRKNRRSLVIGPQICVGDAGFCYQHARREFPSKPTRGFHPRWSLSLDADLNGSFIDTGVDGSLMTSRCNNLWMKDLLGEV